MYLKTVLLLTMLFCHIVDDYYLQGWLAQAKQKEWWTKNAPHRLYKNDYIMALCEHAFSWTFTIMLVPTIYTYFNPCDAAYKMYVLAFAFNWVLHCVVDDCKANKKKINLICDQLIHILQVIITWIVFIATK